jgi:bifunctional protein folD
MKIFDGKKVSQAIAEDLKKEVSSLKETPKLVVMSVGNDLASMSYIKSKTKMATFIGIELEHAQFSEGVAEEVLIEAINQFNNDERVNGIILQLPLPQHLNASKLSSLVRFDKDVDGFSSANMGKLCLNQPHFIPCTPSGILDILDFYNYNVEGKSVVILGRSNIVGKPLTLELINRGATVTVCNSKTEKTQLRSLYLFADVVVVATGCPNTINFHDIKNVEIVIDVGINRLESGKLVGDVNFESLLNHQFSGIATPVPGGVGLMTVVNLMKNTILAYKLQQVNQKGD